MNSKKDVILNLIKTYPKWHLLPVGSNKAPMISNGVHGASNDPKVILNWLDKYPNMNIAVATFISGFIAIDIDKKDGMNGEDSLVEKYGSEFDFPYQDHLWAKTPRAGKHLLFESSDAIKATAHANVLPLVDIRSRNAYICIEPSVNHYKGGHTGSYKFHNLGKSPAPMTDWALDFLNLAVAKKKSASESRTIQLPQYIKGIPSGDRDESLFRLALMLRKQGIEESVALGVVRTFAEKCIPPFPECDAIQKVIRVYKYKFQNNTGGVK